MPRRVFHQYRSMARDGIRRAGEVEQSPEAKRAAIDFPYFCEYLTQDSAEPKIQPEHMQEWNRHLLTNSDSQALIGISGPNVDILSPRGSAKSTYLGMFAAWAIGRHAMARRLLQILYISYTVDVARPKSASIKSIIESSRYREVFPSVVPGRKWSDEYWCIDLEFANISVVGQEAFTLCCAGLKGAIVSKRCLVGDTMVLTEAGEMRIDRLGQHIGLRVLTFNESANKCEWKRILAHEGRMASDIVEVRTDQGCQIRCTSDHPFYVIGKGYRDASDLVPGDPVVRVAKHAGDSERVSSLPTADRQEEQRSPVPGVLYLGQGRKNRSRMLSVQTALSDATVCTESENRESQKSILFSPLPWTIKSKSRGLRPMWGGNIGSRIGNRAALLWDLPERSETPIACIGRKTLRGMWGYFQASKSYKSLLLQSLFKPRSLGKDVRRRKQQALARAELWEGVSGSPRGCLRSRWEIVQNLFGRRSHREKREMGQAVEFTGPSSQPLPHGQPHGESDNDVSWLPYSTSQVAPIWETDTIASVSPASGIESVYDIEVEGTHNFFANGICVHNSHLILLDDLIKSEFDIANPEIREQMQQNWSRSILPTMFDGGRAVCLGTRFRADDIHCTTFTPDNGWVQIEQSAIIEDPETGNEKTYWDFWSLEHLKTVRNADPIGFSFQYQNKIVKTTDVSIAPEWINRRNVASDISQYDSVGFGVDLSSKTKERHDYTVFVLGARKGNHYYILDMWRGREAGNKTKIDRLLELCYEWGLIDYGNGRYLPGDITAYLWAEDVAYQASMQGDFRSIVTQDMGIYNLVYRPVHNKGDKLAKLRSVTGLFENGLVSFNNATPLAVAIEELISFGATAHDDCADAIGYLLNGLRSSAPLDSV